MMLLSRPLLGVGGGTDLPYFKLVHVEAPALVFLTFDILNNSFNVPNLVICGKGLFPTSHPQPKNSNCPRLGLCLYILSTSNHLKESKC